MIASDVRRQCEKATSLYNHNGDDTIARCSRIKFSTNILIYRKAWPLVATEPECGGCPVAEEGHKCDSRPVDVANLQDADETVDGRSPRLNHATDKDISTSSAGEDKNDKKECSEEALHRS